MDKHGNWQPCQLCGRDVPPELITLHHLRPRQKGGKAEDRVPLCRPCHKPIHAVFSNTELARGLATIEQLKEAERLQDLLRWIRKQKGDRNFRTVMANGHASRRRSR